MNAFRFEKLLIPLFFFLLLPGYLIGQDLTETELQEFQEIRESLIREGFIQEASGFTLLQTDGEDPLIINATYTNKSESFSTENSRDTDFQPNGNRFYIVGRQSLTIEEYHLSSSWNIESASLARELDISGEMGSGVYAEAVPHGLYIRKDDGEKMWVFNRREIWEYTLSTPWNISTATQTGYKDLSDKVMRGHSIDFKPDGSVLYVDDRMHEGVFQYTLSDPWDIATASLDDVLDISNQQEEVRGIELNSDGSRMYLMDTGRKEVLEYHLSSSYDLGSAGFIGSYSVGSQTTDPRDITFKPDFRTFYVTSAEDNRVFQYDILTADPDESTLAASREKVIADHSATSRITVVIRNEDGERLQGVKVQLESNSSTSTIDAQNSTTDSNGEARFDVRNSVEEIVTYTARASNEEIHQSVTVRFVSVDPDESSIASNREKVISNGSATALITVVARDEEGDELQGVEFSLIPENGSSTVTNVQNVTDSEGRAEFRVANNVSESVEYSARGMGVTLSGSVIINFVTVDPSLSTVAVHPEKVQADGEEKSTITIKTKDEDGDNLPGAFVELKQNGSTATIETVQDITDSNAEAFFRVSSTLPSVVKFTVIAEGVELDQTAVVNFVPIAPVAFAASEVGNRQFTANWESVEGTDSYLLDVATDSSFSNPVPGYQSREVGLQTSYVVDEVEPGTKYFYRVRARADGLESADSEIISTTTFPDTPVAIEPTKRSVFRFTANWDSAAGAQRYRLDVARDPGFEQMVQHADNVNAGSALHYTVEDLEMGKTYYYRVRSEAGPRLSGYSNTIEASTLVIDSELSEINSEQLRVLANGNQSNELKVIVRSEEGILLEGLQVELTPTGGNSEIESIQPVTDGEGVALFSVTSTTAGKVTYHVTAAGIPIGEINVEFLQDDGRLKLGDNYPNPFHRQTTIPLTVPRPMQVNVTIFNSLGAPVRTLLDQEMETGYFEIPFHSHELASGVYFYRVIAEGEVMTEKMVLVK
ncbi:MAG: Ig-like domain-containing protein [Balneolaceae bacterium]